MSISLLFNEFKIIFWPKNWKEGWQNCSISFLLNKNCFHYYYLLRLVKKKTKIFGCLYVFELYRFKLRNPIFTMFFYDLSLFTSALNLDTLNSMVSVSLI